MYSQHHLSRRRSPVEDLLPRNAGKSTFHVLKPLLACWAAERTRDPPPRLDNPHTMSSPFIKRAKSRSNIRQRDGAGTAASSPLAGPGATANAGGEGEGDEEGDGAALGMSPMALAQQRKKEKDRKRSGLSGSSGKTRLSFGGAGDETEVRSI